MWRVSRFRPHFLTRSQKHVLFPFKSNLKATFDVSQVKTYFLLVRIPMAVNERIDSLSSSQAFSLYSTCIYIYMYIIIESSDPSEDLETVCFGILQFSVDLCHHFLSRVVKGFDTSIIFHPGSISFIRRKCNFICSVISRCRDKLKY